jgi:hypothetical protein
VYNPVTGFPYNRWLKVILPDENNVPVEYPIMCSSFNCQFAQFRIDFDQTLDVGTNGVPESPANIKISIEWSLGSSEPQSTTQFTLEEWRANNSLSLHSYPCQFQEYKAILVQVYDSEGLVTEWRFELEIFN